MPSSVSTFTSRWSRCVIDARRRLRRGAMEWLAPGRSRSSCRYDDGMNSSGGVVRAEKPRRFGAWNPPTRARRHGGGRPGTRAGGGAGDRRAMLTRPSMVPRLTGAWPLRSLRPGLVFRGGGRQWPVLDIARELRAVTAPASSAVRRDAAERIVNWTTARDTPRSRTSSTNSNRRRPPRA